MRIISQDNMYDFPYELCAIYLNKEPMGSITVRCRWQADQNSSNVLAQYSNMENAQKAMQMLHDAFGKQTVEYENGIYCFETLFKFPSNKDIEESKERGDKMTKEEFASGINGREYGSELTKLEEQRAKDSGLVIVFGASDDLMEFRGAINDEDGCYDGGDVYFDRTGVDQNGEKLANKITAVWCGRVDDEPAGDLSEFQTENGETITWTYKTDIPHATFMVYEDGDPYCRGIVFSIEDTKQ